MLILSGVFMFILLVIAFSVILKETLTLSKIENELNKIKKEVVAADALEREYEKIVRQKLTLQEIQANNPSRLGILKQLTSLLPSDLWLSNLVIKKDAVEITGSADSTSQLIPLLEKSDIFTDVHFVDSIKRIKNREQFKIKLPLKKVKLK
jgi:general secretion pathway protein L